MSELKLKIDKAEIGGKETYNILTSHNGFQWCAAKCRVARMTPYQQNKKWYVVLYQFLGGNCLYAVEDDEGYIESYHEYKPEAEIKASNMNDFLQIYGGKE
tara:strand:+ start:123 stop:425 length:303 start_codon:yes stop_codon:yes gene_type:complete